MNDANTNTSSATPKWKWVLWLLLVVAVVIVATIFPVREWLNRALDWISGLGGWGLVVFIVFYAVATVLLVPGSLLTLGAGAIFGVVKGAIAVSIGATLGAAAAFLVGRYLARDWISRKIAGNAKFAAIDKAVADQGWKIVGLTRLSPIFPFTLLNYIFGVTRVSLRDYVLATWIGILPGTVVYVYVGSLARAVGSQTRTPAEWALFGFGLLATALVTIFVTRIARRALAQHLENGQPQP
ncbi:MAG: associated Golgi protein [Pedosphaera sp.]|nr:associated Golgi protein [Pedosphaera sp.]